MTLLLDAQPDAGRFMAALNTESPRAALCLEMQFKSGSMFMSDFNIDFEANGAIWRGLGELVGISEPSGGAENLNSVMEYSLGLPWEILDDEAREGIGRIPALMGNAGEYSGRTAILSVQLFDDNGPVGPASAVHVGRMEKPRIHVQVGSPVLFQIDAESILVRKRTPPAGKLTDADQKSRHPTDQGLEFVPNAASEAVDWLNS